MAYINPLTPMMMLGRCLLALALNTLSIASSLSAPQHFAASNSV